MSQYTINDVGSNTFNFPSSIETNDELIFNATNVESTSINTGTVIPYKFPCDCIVQIEARGARGGKGNKCDNGEVGKGAYVYGTFEFKKDEEVLILVGQAGTDFVGSFNDGTTGAGGGGSFVVKRVSSGGDTYTGDGNGKGWNVIPLIIAAGGNGGRDIGYSGRGEVYHGESTEGPEPALETNYSGGGYKVFRGTGSCGRSFLVDGKGAANNYSRNGGTSYAGFGGGGGNRDDGQGGGGGGYYGGELSTSAYSYNSGSSAGGTTGENFGHGKVIFRIIDGGTLDIKLKVSGSLKEYAQGWVKINGALREIESMHIKINGALKEC